MGVKHHDHVVSLDLSAPTKDLRRAAKTRSPAVLSPSRLDERDYVGRNQ